VGRPIVSFPSSTPLSQSAGEQHYEQHEENDPAKATAHIRATVVSASPAEQQQKDEK